MSVYQLDLNKPVHVHFIGIGGISMNCSYSSCQRI